MMDFIKDEGLITKAIGIANIAMRLDNLIVAMRRDNAIVINDSYYGFRFYDLATELERAASNLIRTSSFKDESK